MTDSRMILGLCGLIGSGKDTVADYLTNFHQFKRESFAASLKDSVAQVFGWPREMLEGRTAQSRDWREQVDEWWAERLNIPHLTPRWVLQYWGTEVCRGGFHDDIWIAALENKLRNSKDSIVITDCRFPNEIKSIRQAGGIIVRVQRGPDPEWFEWAKSVNYGPEGNSSWCISKTKLEKTRVHASETSWIGTDFDYVLDNNAGIEELYSEIKHLVANHQSARVNRPFQFQRDSLNTLSLN